VKSIFLQIGTSKFIDFGSTHLKETGFKLNANFVFSASLEI